MKAKRKTIEALILNAAMDVFSSGDFEQATMRSIAEKANVPTSSIYKYFTNKDDLYVTLVSIIVDRTNQELNMHLTGLSSTKSKIREMARFHLNFFQDNLHIARLVFASTNLSYWYEYQKAYEKVKESGSALARIIREGQRNGEIRDDLNLRVVNHIYFGALRAMVINWLYRRHVYQLSDLSEPFADAIYGAIRANDAKTTQFVCPLMEEGNATNMKSKKSYP
ncbi:MAG: TetR/AcrR family transcriptional regulator [Dehalococcoidia bacterium]|jgi:TetR/AcrR family fatty acid metabolism transcriptional regulator